MRRSGILPFALLTLSAGFRVPWLGCQTHYLVTLDPEKHTYSCVEQDAGYNNGRLRAYRGYNRGVKVNGLTMLISLIQRGDRKQRTGSATPAHKYTLEELKAPLRAVLESNGWKRTGLIR